MMHLPLSRYIPIGNTPMTLRDGRRHAHIQIDAAKKTTAIRAGWRGQLDKIIGRVMLGHATECDSEATPEHVFFDRLLKDIDPHHEAPKPDLQPRILAGRWLALRRIHLGLSYAYLTQSTGVTASALLLLEAGLGDETLASARGWELLAEALDGRVSMVASTVAVLSIALGRIEVVDPILLAQVADDLSHFTMAAGDDQHPHILPIHVLGSTPECSFVPAALRADLSAYSLGIFVVLMGMLIFTLFLIALVQHPFRTPQPIVPRPIHISTAEQMHNWHPNPAVMLSYKRESSSCCELNLPMEVDHAEDHWQKQCRHVRRTRLSNPDRCQDAVRVALTRAELVEEAVAQTPRLLLLGETGSGKSTSLRHLTQRLSESCLDAGAALPAGWQAPTIPILCSLETFADTLTGQMPCDEQGMIQCLLQSQLTQFNTFVHANSQYLRQALLHGEALLLLDGLHECRIWPTMKATTHAPRSYQRFKNSGIGCRR